MDLTDQTEATVRFDSRELESVRQFQVLKEVYEALAEKGYDPVRQIIGYLMSGDPAYITSHKNARSLIRRVERDDLLEEMLRAYLTIHGVTSPVQE